MSYAKQVVADQEVGDMLECKLIQPSNSPWASVVQVTEKDGSTRFCIDYRQLNDVMVKDAYPIPRLDDALNALDGEVVFHSEFDQWLLAGGTG